MSANRIRVTTEFATIWSATSNANVSMVFTAAFANTTSTSASLIPAETEDRARIFRYSGFCWGFILDIAFCLFFAFSLFCLIRCCCCFAGYPFTFSLSLFILFVYHGFSNFS